MTFIQLETNTGHAHARNMLWTQQRSIRDVLDADDQLASYAIEYYLNHINGLDTLIADTQIYNATSSICRKDKIRLQYRSHHSYPNSILEKKLHVIFYLEMQLLKHMTLNLMKI